VRRIKAVLF
jgi:hypothetical protein